MALSHGRQARDDRHRPGDLFEASEEQKQRWLPAMARGEKLGAFALTEPRHGSDSVSLETEARRVGDEYVINGAKRWIGNGTLADVVVVWARDAEDLQVKGFLVEKGTPGYGRGGGWR
jgi:glutaryl-CoA dehydrogenase